MDSQIEKLKKKELLNLFFNLEEKNFNLKNEFYKLINAHRKLNDELNLIKNEIHFDIKRKTKVYVVTDNFDFTGGFVKETYKHIIVQLGFNEKAYKKIIRKDLIKGIKVYYKDNLKNEARK